MAGYTLFDSKVIHLDGGLDIYIDGASLTFQSRIERYADYLRDHPDLTPHIFRARIRPSRSSDKLAYARITGTPILELDTDHDGGTVIVGVVGIRDRYEPTPVWTVKAWDRRGLSAESSGDEAEVLALTTRIILNGITN